MTAVFAIHNGDCLEVLRTLDASSVESIVTDPPYGLSFMGKRWDYDVPSAEIWAECLRVLKPGGYLLAFAGTRTQHRMAVRIEDAGFEIRDMIAWVYGSGFPKSHNGDWGGTALKPALEPITMARKPLIGTVEDNWREYGTGALNIDGCRVLVEEMPPNTGSGGLPRRNVDERRGPGLVSQPHPLGRWPANLIHDGGDEVLAGFPNSNGSGPARKLKRGERADGDGWGMSGQHVDLRDAGTGSAARFFYCAKASKSDRDEGLTTPPQPFVQFQTGNGASGKPSSISEGRNTEYRNAHPTVKPTDLMRYLCRLVTPPGGVVLDPFMGSGSTGKAAVLEGFRFIGVEREAEYVDIARARIAHAAAIPVQRDLLDEAA